MATTDRCNQLTDDQWARIEPLLPSSAGGRGPPFRNFRRILEGMIYRYRIGIPRLDLPKHLVLWQTVCGFMPNSQVRTLIEAQTLARPEHRPAWQPIPR